MKFAKISPEKSKELVKNLNIKFLSLKKKDKKASKVPKNQGKFLTKVD